MIWKFIRPINIVSRREIRNTFTLDTVSVERDTYGIHYAVTQSKSAELDRYRDNELSLSEFCTHMNRHISSLWNYRYNNGPATVQFEEMRWR